MFKKTILVAGLGLALIGASPARAGDDALLGALLGAGVGAVIGHHAGGDRGAVIGGAIGAVAGASIADDGRRYQRTHYDVYDEPRGYAPPAYVAPAPVYVPAPPAYVRPAPVVVDRIVYEPPRRDWRERRWHGDERGHGYRRGWDRNWRRDEHCRDEDRPRRGDWR